MAEPRVVGYNGLWVRPEDDPRTQSDRPGELGSLRDYLTSYRLTLGMKCDDLSPDQLAARSVPPSTLSLLGLVRHMAQVEHGWFVRVLQGRRDDTVRPFWSDDDHDWDFNGAVADPAAVTEAFTEWKAQIAAADAWLDTLTEPTDLGTMATTSRGNPVSYRDVLVHMVEEYARHCGHADLLRECIDGRTGQ
jgi:uncharacterized damage-inducible protein DinB